LAVETQSTTLSELPAISGNFYILKMNYRPQIFIGVFALISALSVPRVSGATATMNPVADAFVTTGPSGNLSGNNYGAGGNLALSAPGSSQGEFQTVLRFDLSAAKAAFDAQYGAGVWSIQSVTLQLTANNPSSNAIFNPQAAGQFQVSWMQNDTWAEGTGNPNAPTTDGISYTSLQSTFIGPNDQGIGTFSVGNGTSGSNTYTLTLTSGFTADLLSGGLVSIRAFAADSSVSYLFNSRTFNVAASRPLLTVNVVTEPSSSVLALAGFSMLIGWRRLRR
jgi:hypothetical protein